MSISDLRSQTGLTQNKFAEKFHLKPHTLQSWEQGWRKCPDYIIWMISRILELENKVEEKE